MTTSHELLETYNPLLVTLPERPHALRRPGARGPFGGPRGDYHPISAEFFLRHATLQTETKRGLRAVLGSRFGWRPPQGPSGEQQIRERLDEQANPGSTRDWFLDLTQIRSQASGQAWSAFNDILQGTDFAQREQERVVYARDVELQGVRLLQYWYLSLYNDAFNNHEGDWEMATIQLNPDGTPYRVAYSAHHGGSWRPWEAVKKDAQSGRPLLFVSRGSHAGRFAYKQRGWRPRSVKIHSGLGPPVDLTVDGAAALLSASRLTVDRPPAIEPADIDWRPGDAGILVDPRIEVFPDDPQPWTHPDFWWMRFFGKWGSAHPRINGTIGPGSPWGRDEGDLRWINPLAWIDDEDCTLDEERSSRSLDLDLSAAIRLTPPED